MTKGHNKTQEMSVEEILESIRKVIGNDSQESTPQSARNSIGTNDVHSRTTPTISRPIVEEEDILELTQPITLTTSPETEEPASDLKKQITNIAENEAVHQINNLIDTVQQSKHSEKNESKSSKLNKTLDEIVIDLLKPQLKEWLDENLPGLITTIVKQEIQKITANIKKH